MISFKDFLLVEDVFAKDGELFAAVNPGATRRPSTPTSISTNLRPLGKQTGLTRGKDVFYAFSYKPSDEDGGSTDLLKSLKGNGPFELNQGRRNKFIDEATAHMAAQFKKMNMLPDVIVSPQSSSSLLHDFASSLAKKLGVKSQKLGAFKKSVPIDLPDGREEALAAVKKIYIDHDYMSQKFTGDAEARAQAEREIASSVLRSIRKHGHIAAKELPKFYAKFVKNIMASDLHGDDEYELMDKSVMVVDDVLSSGTTMSDLFRAVTDLGAKNVWGATLFARTSNTEH